MFPFPVSCFRRQVDFDFQDVRFYMNDEMHAGSQVVTDVTGHRQVSKL